MPTPAPLAALAAAAGPPVVGALWRARLHGPLRGRGHPVLHTGGARLVAAALRAGARRWSAWLRAAGVGPGDRVVCALPAVPAFVMVLLAALGDGLTLAPVAPGSDVDEALATVDARLAIVPDGDAAGAGGAHVIPDAAGGPPAGAPPALRRAAGAPSPSVRLLLETSGTAGARRRIALSDANVLAVVDAHAPPLALAGATLLSVLPWHHAFGLVLELLPALLAGAAVVRDPAGGRDLDALLALAAAHPVTHLSAVPRTVRLLGERPDGAALLARLRGGVVGGAAVDAALAARLAGTRLRVGYGQTEASPGICLGEPGAWRAGALGRPLGCAVRLDADGVLAFRGPNACLGEWRDGALLPADPDGWRRTGDLARAAADGSYTFEGRLADSFKLANGRFVAAAAVEAAVRARFPDVREALLSSPDGEALVLACTAAGPLPAVDAVRPLLGPLAGRPLRVVAVDAARWARTPKGELDRRWPVGR